MKRINTYKRLDNIFPQGIELKYFRWGIHGSSHHSEFCGYGMELEELCDSIRLGFRIILDKLVEL